MQIIIDINDDLYKSIKDNCYIYEEEAEEIAFSIIGGIPLTKGYENLIDKEKAIDDSKIAITNNVISRYEEVNLDLIKAPKRTVDTTTEGIFKCSIDSKTENKTQKEITREEAFKKCNDYDECTRECPGYKFCYGNTKSEDE